MKVEISLEVVVKEEMVLKREMVLILFLKGYFVKR